MEMKHKPGTVLRFEKKKNFAQDFCSELIWDLLVLDIGSSSMTIIQQARRTDITQWKWQRGHCHVKNKKYECVVVCVDICRH